MFQQPELAFIEPYDQPFRYLEAIAIGRTIDNALVSWTLDARTSRLTLKNNLGTKLLIGITSKVVVRCSLAFLKHTTPYVALEYIDGTSAIFTADLKADEPTLSSIDVDLESFRDITLTYWRSAHRDKLIVMAIGEGGVYSGTLDGEHKLEIALFNRVEVTEPKRMLHRVGVNTANQLQTELVDIATNQ